MIKTSDLELAESLIDNGIDQLRTFGEQHEAAFGDGEERQFKEMVALSKQVAAGEDVAIGDLVMRKGRVLDPPAIGLLACNRVTSMFTGGVTTSNWHLFLPT